MAKRKHHGMEDGGLPAEGSEPVPETQTKPEHVPEPPPSETGQPVSEGSEPAANGGGKKKVEPEFRSYYLVISYQDGSHIPTVLSKHKSRMRAERWTSDALGLLRRLKQPVEIIRAKLVEKAKDW